MRGAEAPSLRVSNRVRVIRLSRCRRPAQAVMELEGRMAVLAKLATELPRHRTPDGSGVTPEMPGVCGTPNPTSLACWP